MKKFQTLDGYQVYRIKKDKRFFFLADRENYEYEITKLLNTVEDINFDSLILIFGIDTGEYIEKLRNVICPQNKVIIVEPNQSLSNRYQSEIEENIRIVSFKEELVKKILQENINFKNINNVYFYAFGNYSSIYHKEYQCLIKNLDSTLVNASAAVSLAKRFKHLFIKNMIANIKILNQCTPIHYYKFTNQNVPAIIVSGGPSLDNNIEDLKKHKDKLSQCFIITGSRTVGALVKNGIKPDLIVSVDPVDANYDMMKDYLNLDTPLAFYEYSNRYLVRDYQGDKVFISLLFSQTIKAFKNLQGVYCGGSVAHSCIDIANMLGCSPIILIGQDLAHTFQKHHADSATHDYDKTLSYVSQIPVKAINGKMINTTITLEHYKIRLEQYIEKYKRVDFINCSYGAWIKGAPHKELDKVLKNLTFSNPKQSLIPKRDIQINNQEVIDTILTVIEKDMIKAEQGLKLCQDIILDNKQKSLMEMEDDDIDLQRFLYILQIVNEFENSLDSHYLGGYLTHFLFDRKEQTFQISAKDYVKVTSDLQHQARVFKIYFEKMKEMLCEVNRLSLETLEEFYE
ncbi:hypothetical protein C8E03_10253 [Lachnotalea glycerini]|uniref:6-hydroxymethylpterin diphosphokinase MptE-like domain-containing protein n=1 Tax=Lachnotalea glycerini TaxID=1763509 RepID=A0A318EQR4_9FIRM|nr:6-hydroxymethylpterin diphosphokinase MptE-like protein [Lachnotalea glycerini]PXV93286.1 hypothetical protein C8E03_10253 [Lachnotalea glycerini]